MMPTRGNSDFNLIKFCEIKSKHTATRAIERYSFGSEIRKFLKMPRFFPLYVYTHHGVYLWNKPHVKELNTKYEGILLFTEELKDKWEREVKGAKLIRTIPHPYLLYLKRTSFKLNGNRKGSLFFFSHSTWDTEIKTNYNLLKKKLDSLESQFRPVRIVLHFIDILKEKHILFEQMGYEIICFGNMYNNNFVENLYNALGTTKYVLSNAIGSHTFYAINIGIPFSLIDTHTNIILPEHHARYNKNSGRHLGKMKKLAMLIGNKINYKNSEDTILFVNHELGVGTGYNKLFIIYFIIKSNMRYIVKKIGWKLKMLY